MSGGVASTGAEGAVGIPPSPRSDVLLVFEPPADPISMNEGDTWGVRARAAAWRDRAHYAWCEAHPGRGPAGRAFGPPAVVWVALPFGTQRRRDPINYAKTVKHVVDGLMMAGAWPDDTLEFVTQQLPTLTRDRHVVVRVAQRMENPQ